jgi:protein-tyrosine-phosphatase
MAPLKPSSTPAYRRNGRQSAPEHDRRLCSSNVLRALAEIGIEHHGRSKSVDEFKGQPFDVVVTVCDSAAEECPVWLGKGKRVHHSYLDPAKATGSDEEVMTAFRAVRDDMLQSIPGLLTPRHSTYPAEGEHKE